MDFKAPCPTLSAPRLKDWELHLFEYVEAVKGQPFEWNRTNCAALVAGCIDAMYGSDLFEWQAKTRLTEKRAAVFSKHRATREALLVIGCAIVSPSYIHRGDILLAYEKLSQTDQSEIGNQKSAMIECSHVVLGLYALSSSPELGVHLVSTESILLGAKELEVFRCP